MKSWGVLVWTLEFAHPQAGTAKWQRRPWTHHQKRSAREKVCELGFVAVPTKLFY